MADIISRLKLESGEFDAKVKRATQGLLTMEQECRKVGGTLGILEKDQKQYVQSLGSMQTVSNTTRGKIAELTQAYTELAMQYRRLTDEEKRGDFGRALTSSLDQLRTRLQDTKAQLAEVNAELNGGDTPSGGLFGGGKLDGMLQVLGGNLMTKGVMMAGELVNKMGEAVSEGLELAKAAEGVRIAFERLDRPDLLSGLREATHGTLTDTELMKAAVRFEDFKLPLDELGTMLAFAQQKAKDTGQSIEYMTESIVTGLGRKSVMILDNLGISAAEIKEEMAKTGDMTKAVGEIIRRQMASAGDYVETAADRAARADAEMKNALEELGRTFQPIAEAGVSMFNSMAVAAINALNKMRPFFDMFSKAGQIRQQVESMGGNTRVNTMIGRLKEVSAPKREGLYQQQVSEYWKYINPREAYLKALAQWRGGNRSENLKATVNAGRDKYGVDDKAIRNSVEAAKQILADYQKQAQAILHPVKSEVEVDPDKAKDTVVKAVTNIKDTYTPVEGSIDAMSAKVQELQKAWRAAADDDSRANIKKQLDEAQKSLDGMMGKVKTTDPIAELEKQFTDGMQSGTFTNLGTSIMDSIRTGMMEQGQQTYENMLSEMTKRGLEGGVSAADVANIMGSLRERMAEDGIIDEDTWRQAVEKMNSMIKNSDAKLHLDFEGGNITTEGDESKQRSEDTQKAINTLTSKMSGLTSGVTQMASGLKSFGFELGEDFTNMMNLIQGLGSIISGASSIISVFATSSQTANTVATHANTIALEKLYWSMIARSFIPGMNTGGVAHAATGLLVGNYRSMDQEPVMVNDGELILNKAQQGNLASQLEGGSLGDLHLEAHVSAEDLIFVLNNDGNRRGLGDLIKQ